MPPWPKPTDQRIRRNKNNDVGLLAIDGDGVNAPAPKEDWSPQIVSEWIAFWNSPLANLVTKEADYGALVRLFEYKFEHEWMLDQYRKMRVVPDNLGGKKMNPLFAALTKLEKIIQPLEEKFGLTPVGRLRLGATLGEAQKSLQSLNADLDRGVGNELDNGADPRDFLQASSD